MKKILAASVIATSVFGLCFNAKAESDFQRQIENLREEVQILQRQSARMGNGSGEDVVMQVTQIEENVRSLNGRLDMLEHNLKALEDKIGNINKDIDLRLNMLEGKGMTTASSDLSVAPAQSEPAKKFEAQVATAAPAAILGGEIAKGDALPEVNTKSPDQIYQEGLDAIKSGDFDLSAARFTTLLTKYPEHTLADNAQYWLGESYYGKKDYTKAAVAFATGYEKYKNGHKGADNILKLGMSMQMLGKKDEACTAFTNLPKEFPKASDVLKDKAAKLAVELDCKK